MTDADLDHAAAVEHVRARDVAAAERLLRGVLAHAGGHVPSLHLLGLLAGRAGRDAECVALLERAVALGTPAQAAAAGLLLAEAHRRRGRTAAAAGAFRTVIAHDPAGLPARRGLCGALLDLGEAEEAAEVAAGGLACAPGDPALTHALAIARNAQGRFGEAAALARAALARGETAGLLNTLGIARKEEDALDDAAACFARALSLDPDSADARYNLASVRKDQGETDAAVALFAEVMRRAPGLMAARVAWCMAHLPPLCRDEREVACRRRAYAEALAVLAEADPAALAQGIGAAQPFYLAYQGENDVALQRTYGAIVCRAAAARHPALPLAPPPRPGERVRVGIVSGHVRDHSVWRLPTRGWVEGLDRARFALAGYHAGGLRDGETARAERLFERFVQGPLPLERWREAIAADLPHVLIYPEIGMDPTVARLAAMRLAPVQYAAWGHPSTTGYPTIDHFLSSADMEPEDGDRHYSERLVRLPGLSTPVALDESPPLSLPRAALGLPEAGLLCWCGQALAKYLPRHDWIFPAIAARAPDARFLFVEAAGGAALTGRFRERLAAAFATRGLDADRHCLFLPRMDAATHRGAMAHADLVLDSIGWSGCNSLVEAIGLGLPIVTCEGGMMRARHGAAILRRLGQERAIAADPAAYVALAAALSNDPARRADHAAAIRMRRARLRDGAGSVEALQAHMLRAIAGQEA